MSILRILPSNREVKAIMAIGGVAVGVALLCLLATAVRLPPVDSWPPAERPWPGNPESETVGIPLARTNVLMPLLASDGQPQFEAQNLPQPKHPQPPAAPGQLPPGVYKTLPYTCIVVVPGPHLDEWFFVTPPGGECPMPIIRPDVQFIPFGQARK